MTAFQNPFSWQTFLPPLQGFNLDRNRGSLTSVLGLDEEAIGKSSL